MSFIIVWLFLSIEKIALILTVPLSILLGPALLLLLFASIGMLVAFLFTTGQYQEVEHEKVKNFIKKFYKLLFNKKTLWLVFIPIFFLGFIGKMLPTKKELAIILAAGGAYELLSSDPAKQIGGKALELINQEIDKALQENREILKEKAEGVVNNSKGMVKNTIQQQIEETF